MTYLEEHVLRLQVPVDDAALVHGRDGGQERSHDVLHDWALVLANLRQATVQIAVLRETAGAEAVGVTKGEGPWLSCNSVRVNGTCRVACNATPQRGIGARDRRSPRHDAQVGSVLESGVHSQNVRVGQAPVDRNLHVDPPQRRGR